MQSLPHRTSFLDLWRFYYEIAGRYRSRLFGWYFVSLLHPLANPFAALFVTLAINFLTSNASTGVLALYVAGVLLLDLTSIVTLYAYRPRVAYYHQEVYNRIIKKSLDHLNTLGLDWYARTKSGEIIHRVMRGAEGLDAVFQKVFGHLLHSSIRIATSIFITLYFLRNAWFFLGIAAYMLVAYIAIRRYRDSLGERYSQYKDVDKQSFADVNNFASGFITVKIANAAAHFIGKTMHGLAKGPMLRWKAITLASKRQLILRSLQSALSSILLFYVGYLIIQGKVQVGILIMVFSVVGWASNWLEDFADVEDVYLRNRAYFDNLLELLSVKPSIEDKKGAKPVPKAWKTINFNAVSFSFGQKKVLRNVSLSIPRRAKIALVGKSGSGKSTMAKLLLKQYKPNKGTISFDETSIFDIQTASLYDTFSYVPQEPDIFDMSIKDNVTFSIKKRNEEQLLQRIYEQTCLSEFLGHLEDGDQTLVGQHGLRISGGERQRLSIARALYHDADIFIFDESTSQIDTRTEKKIWENLKPILKHKTVIIIAHHQLALQTANEVYVLEKGTIASKLSRKGQYVHYNAF